MADPTGTYVALYASPWEALRAGFAAANAPCFGLVLNPRRTEMGGKPGVAMWTDRDKAEAIAAGLRLTGFEVVLLPGYSVGVAIITGPDVAVDRG